MQNCPTDTLERTGLWPSGADFRHKLWGSKEEIQTTAQFIKYIHLQIRHGHTSIWTQKKKIRLDSCPKSHAMNEMQWKFGLLSLRKASSHSTALCPAWVFFFLCSVFVFPYHRLWGLYSFTTDGYGIFNVRTNLGARLTHEVEIRHKQVCTRVGLDGQKKKMGIAVLWLLAFPGERPNFPWIALQLESYPF